MPVSRTVLIASLVLTVFLTATNATAITQEELFGSYSGNFDLETFSSQDFYMYFSDDDICWVEIEGDLMDVEVLRVNTEPGSASEISRALDYQRHFLDQAMPSASSTDLLTNMIDQYERTGRTQTATVDGIEVEFYMESLGGGVMGYNTQISF